MGLGAHLRNLQIQVTDTDTARSETYEVVTDIGGAYPTWSTGPYRGAMAIPGAWRAALLRSDLLGAVPWHAYRDGPDGVAERITPTPLLLEQPAPPHAGLTSRVSWALDLIWHGNAVGVYTSPGDPDTGCVPVSAAQVGVRLARLGDPVGFRPGEVVYSIGGRDYHPDQVFHVLGPSEPGALRGMGVLECHLAGGLALASELARQAGAVADSAVPSLKIKSLVPDLQEGEAAALKASVMASQRTRQPIALNATTDVEPLSWNPTETQLLDARKFSLHELALIFGLDPSWLGAATSSRVYANVEQEALNLWRYSALAGDLARFEAAYTAALPPGQWAQANLDARLRADTLTRYQAHEIGIRTGVLTVQEARELENRRPLTDAELAALRPPEPAPAAPPPGGGS